MNTDFTVLFSSMGDFIEKILDSTITSNVVAIVSLVVTFQTMKSAKDIKEEMEKMQTLTYEKIRFKENKPQLIKNLQEYNEILSDAGKLSKSFCRKVFCLVKKIKGYEEIFKENDFQKLEASYEKIKAIVNKQGIYDDTDINDCLELIVELENILSKGEYSLWYMKE